MARIRAFHGLRPIQERVQEVAAPPYDVVDTEEARQIAEGRPRCVLHVSRAEIDVPAGTDIHDPLVYETARQNLRALIEDGTLVREAEPALYAYRQQMGDHIQTGLVVAASVDDYLNNVIKKHEHTRRDKEDDRTNHTDICNANVGPVFLTYRAQDDLDAIIAGVTAGTPEYDIVSLGDVRHTLWVIRDAAAIEALVSAFAAIPELYVADGHHRSASAARVGALRRQLHPDFTGEEPFNYFLAVLFPDRELRIMDYNRLVRDLNGHTPEAFLTALQTAGFEIVAGPSSKPAHPAQAREFGMFLTGGWYRLRVTPTAEEAAHPVKGLDASLLQERVLHPLLAINDPRTDKRIDFVGGIRGLGELSRRVGEGKYAVAFALYPTSLAELMAIADAGEVMPPKSTWFEPKLLSGFVIHELS